jgi:hypothetical protein
MNRVFSFYDQLGGEKGMRALYDLFDEKYNNASWKGHFPWDTPQYDLTFNVLTAQSNIAPMASIIDINAPKPTRSTQGYGTYGGAIPKLGHGFDIVEQTLRMQQVIFSQGGAVNPRILADILFNKADKLIQGAHNRMTYMDDQVRSTGKLIINVDNNPDGIGIEVDYRVPAENFLKAGFNQASKLAWSDPNADPIQDLLNMVEYADKHNIVYGTFEMSKSLFNTFLSHPKVLEWVRARMKIADNVSYPLGRTEVIAALDGYGSLPPIKIYDGKQVYEEDGISKSIHGFSDKNVVLRPSGAIGKMKNAVSMHTLAPSTPVDFRTTVEQGRIAILNQWDSRSLINHIELEGYAVPALDNPKNILILDTTEAAV